MDSYCIQHFTKKVAFVIAYNKGQEYQEEKSDSLHLLNFLVFNHLVNKELPSYNTVIHCLNYNKIMNHIDTYYYTSCTIMELIDSEHLMELLA